MFLEWCSHQRSRTVHMLDPKDMMLKNHASARKNYSPGSRFGLQERETTSTIWFSMSMLKLRHAFNIMPAVDIGGLSDFLSLP